MDDKIKELRKNADSARNYFTQYLAYTVGPLELKNIMEEGEINLLDVRRHADYEISHIPGAVCITKEELADNLVKLDKEKITVVYSYNSQCHLGAECCLILADYSYPCVLLLGGFKVWKEDFRFVTT